MNPQAESAPATSDPRGWTAGTIDRPDRWFLKLSADWVRAALDVIRRLDAKGDSITAIPSSALPSNVPADWLEDARQALERGRGFVVLRGFSKGALSSDQLKAAYWLVGHALGKPFEQNVEGTLLYDVRNTGRALTEGARFSVTKYESSFHTDNSFGDDVLDYVGLLCLHGAKSGGVSQVVSGYAAYERLRDVSSRHLALLQQSFHVDRRGGVKPGQGPTAEFPIIGRLNDELLYRYLRYWIQVGHDKVGQPLTPDQCQALDALDEVLRQPDLRAEFLLEPGDMFFINNRWILHNRTAFEDYPEEERRRHYVRLWLQRR